MTKRKLGKFEIVSKGIQQLAINEITTCRKSGRYYRTSIGRDKNGYFVTTHRCRSKSYSNVAKIPNKEIQFIRSTG